jgi:hypothetical protein
VIFEMSRHPMLLQDVSLLVTYRDSANQKPAVSSISADKRALLPSGLMLATPTRYLSGRRSMPPG